MNLPIISQKSHKVNRFQHYQSIFFVLVIIAAITVSGGSQSEPKDFEYEETTGTIRKIGVKKVFGKWVFLSWILKDVLYWSTMAALAVCVFGQWGLPISWIAARKAVRSGIVGLSLLSEVPMGKIMLQRCRKTARIALIFSLFLFLSSTAEASIAGPANSPLATMEQISITTCVAVSSLAAMAIVRDTDIGPPLPGFQANCELFRKRYKLSIQQQVAIYQKLREAPQITSKELLLCIPDVKITENQLNRIRKEWKLSRRRGRPKKEEASKATKQAGSKSNVLTHLPKAGLTLFDLWLKETDRYQEVLQTIYALIDEYKKEYPEENFRLLKTSQGTVARKWKALNLLALAEIKKLSELDYKQHDLDRLLVDGHSYSYSALRQFLGDLERINAGVGLKTLLAKCVKGDWAYIDGHMIPFWSRVKMNKGYITMLGRIMSGSKLVVAHDLQGQAIGLEYYPPDAHLINIIEDFCKQITALTGVTNFVIDREINSVEIARLFDRNQWGLICMLDANEYKGLESFSKTFSKELSDGTRLYKASWMHWRNDPRRFVVVEEKDRTLVYWYTRKIARQRLTAEQIISLYRRRSELQENSFKRMQAHGALNTNFGVKKVWGLDRAHQRKIKELDKKIKNEANRLHKLEAKIDEQVYKVEESIAREHGRLFDRRIKKLENLEDQEDEIKAKISNLEKLKQQLGEPISRSDRDFRKQTIMSFRTLWIENALKDFVSLLTKSMEIPVDIEIVIALFFYRRGIMVESDDKITYWIDSKNLSDDYQGILKNVIEGFNRISLTYRSKKIWVQIAGPLQPL